MNLRHWTRSAPTPEEAWSRNLTILLTAIFIEEIGWSLTAPFLPLYVRELGIGDPKEAALWAGLVMGPSLAIGCAMTPVWAGLADRFGSKLILLRALVALAVANFAVGLVGSVEQLVAVRLVAAFFTGLVPLSYAVITSAAPQATLAQSVALLQTVTIAAASLGPLIGGLMVDRIGLRPGYFCAAALCVCGLLLVLVAFHNPLPAAPASAWEAPRRGLRTAVVTLLPLVAILFLVQTIDRSFQPLIPAYVEELGGAAAGGVGFWSGLTVSLAGAAMAIAANAMARLSRRTSPVRLLLFALGGGALCCAPIAALGSVWQLTVTRTLLSLAAGGAPTLIFTVGSALGLARGSIGRSSVLVMGQQMGGAVGPLLGGAVAQWSLRGVFAVNAALYLATLLFAGMVMRRRPRQDRLGAVTK
jgi:DHA1 family multidrug resistance protein-like MFS transporter